MLGSVLPDFSYFFGTGTVEELAHRFIGSMVLCLPAGLLILWLICLAHKLLSALLPRGYEFLLPPKEQLSPAASPIILPLSLLLGIWSHLLCDGLTHRTGWFVLNFRPLQAPIGVFLGHQVRIFNLVWYLSSFLGVAWVVLAFEAWRRQHRPAPMVSGLRQLLVAFVVATVALLLALVHHIFHNWLAIYFAGFLGFLFLGAAVWAIQRWRRSILRN